jgi:hypothetical protein
MKVKIPMRDFGNSLLTYSSAPKQKALKALILQRQAPSYAAQMQNCGLIQIKYSPGRVFKILLLYRLNTIGRVCIFLQTPARQDIHNHTRDLCVADLIVNSKYANRLV